MIGYKWLERCLTQRPFATTLGYLFIATLCLWQLRITWWLSFLIAFGTTALWWCIYGPAIRQHRLDVDNCPTAPHSSEEPAP